MADSPALHYRVRWTPDGPQAELRQLDGEQTDDGPSASDGPDNIISSLNAAWSAFEAVTGSTGEQVETRGVERAHDGLNVHHVQWSSQWADMMNCGCFV